MHRRLRSSRYLHDRSDCYRLERQLPGGPISHREIAPFHGAHTVELTKRIIPSRSITTMCSEIEFNTDLRKSSEAIIFNTSKLTTRLVERIAGHDLIRERNALRRHDQRDHHLHTIGSVVARVTETALVPLRERWVALEIRAGQIVEQYVKLHRKQVLPAVFEKCEQPLLVLEQMVKTTIQSILGGQLHSLVQKISHRTALVPLPMQSPLAARIDPAVSRQHHQYVPPRGPFSRVLESLAPELIELQLLPQPTKGPTCAPLPWPLELELRQLHLYAHIPRVIGNLTIRWKQREPALLLVLFIKRLDRLHPAFTLAVVDLTQIQHVPIDGAITRDTLLLRNTPIAVFFAVFEPTVALQVHGP